MSETQSFHKARKLISENKKEAAATLLWRLYSSKSPIMRLNAILSLTEVIDQSTENEKLLKVSDKGIEISTALKLGNEKAFLMGKKGSFLLYQLALLIHRKRSLKLAADVFTWIDFSLEKEKNEFEKISRHCHAIEEEVQDIEIAILELAESSTDLKLRGHIFASIGDFYNSRYMTYKIDLLPGGKFRRKIGNIYFTKRWNLDDFLYSKENRQQIRMSKIRCIYYYKKAIQEFEAGNRASDVAYTCYNLANNLRTMFKFLKAKQFLFKAKKHAEILNEKRMLDQIELLRKRIADKNRNISNYAKELGNDLP